MERVGCFFFFSTTIPVDLVVSGDKDFFAAHARAEPTSLGDHGPFASFDMFPRGSALPANEEPVWARCDTNAAVPIAPSPTRVVASVWDFRHGTMTFKQALVFVSSTRPKRVL